MMKYAETMRSGAASRRKSSSSIKQAHAKTARNPHPGLPSRRRSRRGRAGPTLSDALTAPVTDASNIKTGRGTFDTLTGTPLGNK